MDDMTLMSQLEQFFSSPGGMLTELESLLGEGCADLTSTLFSGDQADLGNQAAASGVDSQMTRTDLQSASQSRQFTPNRTRPGLLGQLLGNGTDHAVTESSFTTSVASEVLPQRPCSLAVSSTYFHRGMYNGTFYLTASLSVC